MNTSCVTGWIVVLNLIAAGCAVRGDAAPRSETYTWRSVAVRGGGFVTGVIAHPRERGLFYARTDVGGAYRWDDAKREWVALTDWIGMADSNLTGCESVAIDPGDPERVYLALGTYTNPNVGNGAIVRSRDRGRTWQRTDMPFKMGANEAGRGNGERLAVDPRDGNKLFFGSRDAGLWKSTDAGATWSRVQSFPKIATENASRANDRWNQPVGIVFVVFDPADSRIIYAGVSTRDTSLYRSTDGGESWSAVANQPTGLRPNHLAIASDGMIYISYGNDPGPNTMTDGAVRKFNPRDDSWTDITPVKPAGESIFGYGCVAVDARDPNTIMATTFCRWKDRDDIFRSTDGGRTWKSAFTNAKWDHSKAPWTADAKPHWMSNVTIDPFDRDHVMFTTGYGIWSCRDITNVDADKPTSWSFDDEGFEETVPIGLISPPEGAHLLSALGDIDGYRHEDLTVAQLQYTAPPRFGNSESIAYAELAPSVIARTGTIRERKPDQTRGTYSTDGGLTWRSFAAEPALTREQRGEGGFGQGSGQIAISADGKSFVWSFRRGASFVSRDNGATWAACSGLGEDVGKVIADRANANTFYAYDSHAGELYVSTDGAATFAVKSRGLPKVDYAHRGFGGGGHGFALVAAPRIEGDLWLGSRDGGANWGGLFHSTDGGATFNKIDGTNQVWTVGFGKAAEGKTYPTIFLAGQVNDVAGIFRSIDAGMTWLRINDDQHQFGWIDHISGDPRIFGRVYFATGGRGIIWGEPTVGEGK